MKVNPLLVIGQSLLVCSIALGQAKPEGEKPKPDMTAAIMPGSRVEKDIAYVKNGKEQQKLDIYAPAAAKNEPVLVFVHGGEWTKGDKAEVKFKPKYFNENGVVFVSINYRLSGVAKHPAQVEDVASAVRWLHDNIETYGGDPKRIFLMGHSAGCHLVTLVSLDPRWLEKVQLKASDLAGVISWSGGAFNLEDKVKAGGTYEKFIRINFGESPTAWRDASPMLHVDEAKHTPPYLFASAELHKPESRLASERMVNLINKSGGQAAPVMLHGKDHTTANHDVGMPGDTTGNIILRFVREAFSSQSGG